MGAHSHVSHFTVGLVREPIALYLTLCFYIGSENPSKPVLFKLVWESGSPNPDDGQLFKSYRPTLLQYAGYRNVRNSPTYTGQPTFVIGCLRRTIEGYAGC